MPSFAVFGNPISHSKSPRIHQLFAEQTGIPHPYDRLCAPLDGFEQSARDFFLMGAWERILPCRSNSRLLLCPVN